ncbi:type VI secretion system protein TssL, long form [Methylobacterium sp. J-090]|uniref:type VI secretion system protein TssL, long form n=1 Tax=Methylobacterium sp. J-090 TaxID=2836666 RepID=UPI001FB8CC7F|nr:type VI secretion system protein TssL, long form [Methylobacterium sp. J-090]MCJ2081706.1 type VI secretion system protein TssL, long form [Methylobacterium sp. J-090]
MSDPFGRNDRTIIVPDPGGRLRPAPESPARMPPQSPASTPPRRTPAPSAPDQDDWATSDLGGPAAPPPPVAPPPGERARALVMKRDVVVAPNRNPYLRAAGPLLLLLGRLRVQLSHASFANLMEQVAASIEDFEADTRASGVPAEQARSAQYIVCATADDIVQNIPAEERHVWAQYSMLSRFFGERTGGVRFFAELDRAKVDPVGNYDLLELLHACLAVGFQGVHRTSASGAATLQQIQRNLYELLRRTRQSDREVSPRWQGQAIATETFGYRTPLWAVGAVVGVLLLGFFLLLRMLLAGSADAAATALVTVHPDTEIGIQRRVHAPPPPPPPPPPDSQAGQIQNALRADIADQSLTVVENGGQVVIRLASALFAPGDASVKPAFQAMLQRVGGLVEREAGTVRVVGHTDSAPIRTVRFPSNFQLSLERARAVAKIVKAGLSKPDRVEIEGKGADVPVTSNKTVEGRARNRRVEIIVSRSR